MHSQTATPVEFTGTAREYFGIWIVNLLLTLLTLGIYSAWAKVRRKKYFYHNTSIDNVCFDYHANPVSILKGRAIAFAFFLLYAFGQHIHASVPVLFAVLFFIFLPWLVVRASIFNARNSSHRGLRFDFDGPVGESFKVFLLLPMLTIITLGTAAPYVARQKNKYMVDHHKFGTTRFDMQATTREFYSVYLRFFGIFILLSLLIGGVLFKLGKDIIPAAATYSPPSVASITANKLNENQSPEELQQRIEKLQQALQKNQSGRSADEAGATANYESFPKPTEPDTRNKNNPQLQKIMKNPGVIFAVLFAYLFLIFTVIGYFQARIGNLVWNSARLDRLSFSSNLRARDLIFLYLSTFILILLSFGMLTPWAQIRLLKYRASKLAVLGEADFDKFVGNKKAEAKATGEEIADMFDIDLSFG